MGWIKINGYRKFKVLTVNPNTQYNLKQVTGVHFTDPKFIYSYEKVVANNQIWNAVANVSWNGTNFWVNTHASISNASVLKVLVYEGDNCNASVSGSSMQRVSVIKRTAVVELNSSNGFRVNVNSLGYGDWNINKTVVVPMLSYMRMTAWDLGYDVTVYKDGSGFYISPKTKRYLGNYVDSHYSNAGATNSVNLRDDCCLYSITQIICGSDTSLPGVYLRVYENGALKYETPNGGNQVTDAYSFSNKKYYGSAVNIQFSGTGRTLKKYEARLRQYIYNDTTMNDCKIKLLLIEGD